MLKMERERAKLAKKTFSDFFIHIPAHKNKKEERERKRKNPKNRSTYIASSNISLFNHVVIHELASKLPIPLSMFLPISTPTSIMSTADLA